MSPRLRDFTLSLKEIFPPYIPCSHKGDYGHVGVVGAGHSGYSGAVTLAAHSALRAGAGRVSAIVSPLALPLMARTAPEVMIYDASMPTEVNHLWEQISVVVFGSGLGRAQWGKDFFWAQRDRDALLSVWDADALYWLAQYPDKNPKRILTPHPGEAAHLLGQSIECVQKDRLGAVRALKEKYAGVIVLKGAGTLVIDEENEVWKIGEDLPVLATAGTGDVLAGLIGGLLAQSLSLSHAACLGVRMHYQAGQKEQEKGTRGMLASDLLSHFRPQLKGKDRPC